MVRSTNLVICFQSGVHPAFGHLPIDQMIPTDGTLDLFTSSSHDRYSSIEVIAPQRFPHKLGKFQGIISISRVLLQDVAHSMRQLTISAPKLNATRILDCRSPSIILCMPAVMILLGLLGQPRGLLSSIRGDIGRPPGPAVHQVSRLGITP